MTVTIDDIHAEVRRLVTKHRIEVTPEGVRVHLIEDRLYITIQPYATFASQFHEDNEPDFDFGPGLQLEIQTMLGPGRMGSMNGSTPSTVIAALVDADRYIRDDLVDAARDVLDDIRQTHPEATEEEVYIPEYVAIQEAYRRAPLEL